VVSESYFEISWKVYFLRNQNQKLAQPAPQSGNVEVAFVMVTVSIEVNASSR
jgi:hypothetical protein